MLHSLLPAMFVGRRSVDEGANDLLASRFHGRLGYAWWFERGKVATLWTHFRSLNLAERYPPTAELAQAYSEHAPAMMLIPWHRRGVRYAQRSHAIRVQLGDLLGSGSVPPLLGGRAVRRIRVRGVAPAHARVAGVARADRRPMGAEQLPLADRDGALPARRPRRGRRGQRSRPASGPRDRGRPGPGDRARGDGRKRPMGSCPSLSSEPSSSDRAKTSSRSRA